MFHPLLDCEETDLSPAQYLHSVGAIFAEFGPLTQDSGNISYGLQVGEERFFIKTAGRSDDSDATLNHTARVALLRNAAQLYKSFRHPLLPTLHRVIESPDGPILVYS